MVSLPDGEKNFEDMFIRFDVIHECDRQTDRRTPGDSKDRAYASHASRGKNCIKFIQYSCSRTERYTDKLTN